MGPAEWAHAVVVPGQTCTALKLLLWIHTAWSLCCKTSEFLTQPYSYHSLMAPFMMRSDEYSSIQCRVEGKKNSVKLFWATLKQLQQNLHSRSMMFLRSAGSYILDQTQNIWVAHQQMNRQGLSWADFSWFVGCVFFSFHSVLARDSSLRRKMLRCVPKTRQRPAVLMACCSSLRVLAEGEREQKRVGCGSLE